MLLVLSVVGASKSYAGDKLMSASFDSVRVYYAMDKVTGACLLYTSDAADE